ncbi:D-3-phosphoglycerate dehydrogenase [Angomonas deanei]|nr:D-3-phosphoglycerate dehydrogenase [Angomonas deanei]|eukprot:EPY42326.1 D-3-phosphoglycerate dehydrogenase [Angomonas deanei]
MFISWHQKQDQIDQKTFDNCPKLLAVGCFCIGTNQVDLDYANERGVAVFNSPFANTRSVAELVIAEIICLARKLSLRSDEVHKGVWNKTHVGCYEVRGKTLGIIGYGHIGSQVGVLAESLGMNVLFYDVVPTMAIGNATKFDDMYDLIALSDFITLHVPETPTTKGMFGVNELKHMKNGSYLLNLSRGTVVDIEALAEEIKSGHVAGAAIDVYPEEPSAAGEKHTTPLQGLPNVILTPHVGGSTEEAQKAIGKEVGLAMVSFINRGTTAGAVNFPQLTPPRFPFKLTALQTST